MERRHFLTLGAASPALLIPPATHTEATPQTAIGGGSATGAADRAYWVTVAQRLADPVLSNLARGSLKRAMPVEEAAGANRAPVTHLEAVGRLLAGLAPWLDLADADRRRRARRAALRDAAPTKACRTRSIRHRPIA